MDWDDLAYFISLVEEQTLTACADKLAVQHSTVSRRIKHLENDLSLKLFNRLGKRYQLTQEGEHLYAQALEIQKQIQTFERMAVEQNVLQGSVVISAPPVLTNELLIKAIPAFKERYPDIVLHIGGDLQIIDLHRKQADIALRLSRPTQDDLVIRTIGHVHYGYFAHKNYIEYTPSDEWQFIEFSANRRLLNWLQSLVSKHDYKIALSSNDLYIIYSSVCEQLGIGILPYFLATKNLDLVAINPVDRTIMSEDEVVQAIKYYSKQNMGSLTCSKISTKSLDLIQSVPLYIVTHPDVRRSARVNIVAQWLGEILNSRRVTV